MKCWAVSLRKRISWNRRSVCSTEVAETNNAMQSNEIFNLAEEQVYPDGRLKCEKELSIRAKRINNSWYWELDKIKPE